MICLLLTSVQLGLLCNLLTLVQLGLLSNLLTSEQLGLIGNLLTSAQIGLLGNLIAPTPLGHPGFLLARQKEAMALLLPFSFEQEAYAAYFFRSLAPLSLKKVFKINFPMDQ